MTRLLSLGLEGGDSILVEVEEPTRGPVTRGRAAETVIQAGEGLEQVLGQLGPAVLGIVSQLRAAELRAANEWPDEVEVEFGVKLSADTSVFIARTGGEANFRIALKWSSRGER